MMPFIIIYFIGFIINLIIIIIGITSNGLKNLTYKELIEYVSFVCMSWVTLIMIFIYYVADLISDILNKKVFKKNNYEN